MTQPDGGPPERIFLHTEGHDVTWCEDRIDESDIEYSRAVPPAGAPPPTCAQKISEVSVVAGPGPVAYMLTEDGSLVVYVGIGLAQAPQSALRSTIEEGYTTWVMRSSPRAGAPPPNDTILRTETALEIVARHRRHVEQSLGAPGSVIPRLYVLDVLEDIERDLRASLATAERPSQAELAHLCDLCQRDVWKEIRQFKRVDGVEVAYCVCTQCSRAVGAPPETPRIEGYGLTTEPANEGSSLTRPAGETPREESQREGTTMHDAATRAVRVASFRDETPRGEPMKLLVSKERLREQILSDPDVETEAGRLALPEQVGPPPYTLGFEDGWKAAMKETALRGETPRGGEPTEPRCKCGQTTKAECDKLPNIHCGYERATAPGGPPSLQDAPQPVVDAVEQVLAEFGYDVSGDCAVHVAHAALCAWRLPGGPAPSEEAVKKVCLQRGDWSPAGLDAVRNWLAIAYAVDFGPAGAPPP